MSDAMEQEKATAEKAEGATNASSDKNDDNVVDADFEDVPKKDGESK